jgi:hypothetical protein
MLPFGAIIRAPYRTMVAEKRFIGFLRRTNPCQRAESTTAIKSNNPITPPYNSVPI